MALSGVALFCFAIISMLVHQRRIVSVSFILHEQTEKNSSEIAQQTAKYIRNQKSKGFDSFACSQHSRTCLDGLTGLI